MLYLLLDVQSTASTDESRQLSAWVNVTAHSEAIDILSEELSRLGWLVTNVIESIPTQETDYFAPCTSLDAFNEAHKGLLALRFKA